MALPCLRGWIAQLAKAKLRQPVEDLRDPTTTTPRQTLVSRHTPGNSPANCTWNHFSRAFFSALFAGIHEECCRKDKEGSVMYRWCRMRTRWRQSLARTVALYPRFGMVLPGLC